jgi:hypothetical protein
MINILTYDETTTITPDEHAMTLEDGTELFYRTWIPREPVRKALVIFHRGHEHSGRLCVGRARSRLLRRTARLRPEF